MLRLYIEMPLEGFPPIARRDARVLILGSMPGGASLAAGEYYAHPRNAFWPIMGDVLGFDPAICYAQRCAALRKGRVALWDVLRECKRMGSLDANIDRASERPNNFAGFFAEHMKIDRVLLNGAKAHDAFRRHALQPLDDATRSRLELVKLPSTSPANASWSFDRKLEAWRAALHRR